jgi:hypothetical protein
MKKLAILFILGLLFYGTGKAQTFAWAEMAGGESSDQAYAMGSDNQTNVYVSGWFSGTAHFGDITLISEGEKDVFIAKYDKNGEVLWAKRAWGAGNDVAAGLTIDWDGFPIITGWFSQQLHFGDLVLESQGSYDMFVARYNADGDIIWAKSAGGEGDDYGNRLTINVENDVLVAGSFRYTANFGNDNSISSEGNRDLFIANYSSAGNNQWVKRAGGAGEDRAYGIVSSATGDIYFTGVFNGNAFFGELEVESTSFLSSYIAKMNAGGEFIWVKKAGGGANDYARGFGISIDGESNVYACGTYSGRLVSGDQTIESTGGQYDFDAYLIKLNQEGGDLWLKTGGGYGMDQAREMFADSSGNSYLSGFYSNRAEFGDKVLESQGESDVFVVKYNWAGEVEWAKSAGGDYLDYAYGICSGKTEENTVFICGNFQEEAFFDDNAVVGWGGQDMFVARLNYANSSVNEIKNNSIIISPNPSEGTFKIFRKDDSLNSKLTIYSMEGKIVYEKLLKNGEKITEISCDLKPATYNLQIMPGNINARIIMK